MDITALIQQSNSWFDFKTKIDALPKKQMGNAFELLTKLYFKINPVYSAYDEVWLLSEVPSKVFEYLGLPSHDLGIDLIAKQGDEYHPIQCKYHSEKNSSITFNEVATFISLLEGNDKFTQGYICSTANVTSKNLDKIKNKPINQILSDKWVQLDEDFFDMIRNYFNNKKYIPTAYIPMEHQVKALKEAVAYFIDGNNARGKLIFPCGAGKSLTGFWMTQALESTATLIAVPSLSLVKQTLDVYLREIVARGIKVKWLCICSDEGIGKDDEVMENTESLGIPCQTDPEYIEKWLETNRNEHKIIFTTYQSGRIIADVSKKLKLSFDVGIFDEAHKTVGLNKKLFSYLLFDDNIAIAKRIFMTATERFYSGTKEDIISMDDYEIYGDTFSQMSFKEAIEKELLTDYKIITIDVKKSEIAEFIKSNNLVQLSNKWKNETEARSLAAMIALRKAMKVLPIKNAVSFHSSIDKAQRNKDLQSYISSSYDFEPIDSFTVSSKVATTKRNDIIREFANSKRALITNAKCLTEGVDVPNIDCIVFADPRKSKVDIVQALGRALRKKKGKQWGYVILPVLYDDATHEIDNDNYNEIISIVRGLAANDERIVEYFKEKNDNAPTQRMDVSNVFDFNFSSDLLDEKALSEQLQIKIWEGLSRFNWMAFEEAREYVRGLGIKSAKEWLKYSKSSSRPSNVPSTPQETYKNIGWQNWADWLGTNNLATGSIEWVNYEIAKKYAQSLSLNKMSDWFTYCKTNSKPHNIPSTPNKIYQNNGWNNWGDFLGIENYRGNNIDWLTFEEARDFIRKIGLKNVNDWYEFARSEQLPSEIPRAPEVTYKDNGWIGIGDWIGTDKVADQFRVYLSFDEAKEFMREHKIISMPDWLKFRKRNNIQNIPFKLERTYAENWIGAEDFFGTLKLGFNEAKEFVSKLKIKSSRDYAEYRKSEDFPCFMPGVPNRFYKDDGWVDWKDFLGYEKRKTIPKKKCLEFIEAMELVGKMKIKTSTEYKRLFLDKEFKTHTLLPFKPERVFKNSGWKDWSYFLGKGEKPKKSYSKNWNGNEEWIGIDKLDFQIAKEFVAKLNIKSSRDYTKYRKSNDFPIFLPGVPYRFYKDKGWLDWQDFLGYVKKNSRAKKTLEFIEAKELVGKMKIKTSIEYKRLFSDNEFKTNTLLPFKPERVFLDKGWKGWDDFLGKEK
jgi:superfamily II DNA or RNA helicase